MLAMTLLDLPVTCDSKQSTTRGLLHEVLFLILWTVLKFNSTIFIYKENKHITYTFIIYHSKQ